MVESVESPMKPTTKALAARAAWYLPAAVCRRLLLLRPRTGHLPAMALRYLSRAVNTPAARRLLASGPPVVPSSSALLRPLASRTSDQIGLGHNNDVADEAATMAAATTKKKKKKKICRTSTGKQTTKKICEEQVTEKEPTGKAASRKMKKIDKSFTGKEQVIQREIVGAATSKTVNNIDWPLLAGNKEQTTGKEDEVEEASEMEKTKIAGEEILDVEAVKKTDGLSFMGEEQVTGKEIVQVASETMGSETDGSDVREEEEAFMTDEEFEQVFAEVDELLANTTSDAIYDRFSLDREFLMVALSEKKPFVQAMYFLVGDLLLEDLESRRGDGGPDLRVDAHGDNGD